MGWRCALDNMAYRLFLKRGFCRNLLFTAAHICAVAPFVQRCTPTSLAEEAPASTRNRRRPLASLSENQIMDIFQKCNFDSNIVKEHGMNGVVLATAIDDAGDLEKIGFKPLQARALYRLIDKWKTTGFPTDEQGSVDCAAGEAVQDITTFSSTPNTPEYAKRDAMNNDYYLARCSNAEATERIQVAAKSSDPLAQAYLAMLYNLGTAHLPRSKEMSVYYAMRAWSWLDQQTLLGCPFSQYALGYLTINDVVTQKTKPDAFILLGMAASRNHAGAQSVLGYSLQHLFRHEDDVAAAQYYKLAADQGYALGQHNYGCCLAHGNGVPRDPEEAVRYFTLAAEQGDAAGQIRLGSCYADGTGVAKNLQEAIKYYRLAAAQGEHEAENKLGVCYDEGVGVAKDPQEAVRYYKLAADHGSECALHNLGVNYYLGTGVTKDRKRAVEYFKRGAQAGCEKSVSALKELNEK